MKSYENDDYKDLYAKKYPKKPVSPQAPQPTRWHWVYAQFETISQPEAEERCQQIMAYEEQNHGLETFNKLIGKELALSYFYQVLENQNKKEIVKGHYERR
jgi:hypothetical protein